MPSLPDTMLRTNLATRPFYNERLIHALIGVFAVLVAVFTGYNVVRLLGLSSQYGVLSGQASRDEAVARQLTSRAAALRRSIDPEALKRVTEAATTANRLIDARAFSWTALFNDIETTLPANVMLTAVAPRVEDGNITITLTVIGREVEAIDTFIERLEETKRFADVLASAEAPTDTGDYQATITGRYLPESHGGAGASAGPVQAARNQLAPRRGSEARP